MSAPASTQPPREIDPRLRIGIHGVRGAGKTSFLGCLYGCPDDRYAVTFSNEQSLVYLQGVWERINGGESPRATQAALPARLSFDLLDRGTGQEWAVEVCDFAGALVQPSVTDDTEGQALKREVRDWLAACDALLFFVDSGDPRPEQTGALDLLLGELARLGPDGRTLARPVALLLTKWDKQGPFPTGGEEEARQVAAFIDASPLPASFRKKLIDRATRQEEDHVREDVGQGQVEVFPVSAFGEGAQGDLPRPGHIRPYNLQQPLAWAAGQAERALRERARRRGNRRTLTAVVITLLLLVVGGLGWLGLRQHAADNFAQLAAFRDAHPGDDNAGQRVAQCEAFLGSAATLFAPAAQREEAEQWLGADADAEDRFEYQAALRKAARHEGEQDYRGAYAAYEAFRTARPGSRHLDGIARRQLSARDLWDQAEWVALSSHHTRAPTDYPGICERARRYLDVPEARYRGDATALMARAATEWDRLRYAPVFDTSQQPLGVKMIEDTRKAAVEYLHGPHPVKAARQGVQAWLDWFEQLRAGKEVRFTIVSIHVPPGSNLERGETHDTRVYGTFNRQPFTTGWDVRGNNAVIRREVGPFYFKWGTPGSLELTVEKARFFLRGRTRASAEVTSDRFILGAAHGVVSMECDNGKTVQVRLECPDAVPPRLRPYPGK